MTGRDATFPEMPGKILNMREGREGRKDSESPNYSYFPLPAKITDGASYKHLLHALFQEATSYFCSFGKMTTHCSSAFKP